MIATNTCPRGSGRGDQLKDDPVTLDALVVSPNRRRAIEVPIGIEDHTATRRTSVAAAGEGV